MRREGIESERERAAPRRAIAAHTVGQILPKRQLSATPDDASQNWDRGLHRRFIICIYVYTDMGICMWKCSAQGDHKRSLLELELQVTASHLTGVLGLKPGPYRRAATAEPSP